MRVFPAQIEFRVASIDGGSPRLQYRQVAPRVIQLAGAPAWGWSEWQDILIVENQGDTYENADETHADETHADERPNAARKNAHETHERKALI